MKKRLAAGVLSAVMLLSSVLIQTATVRAADGIVLEQNRAVVSGSVGDAPDEVSLTQIGSLDWVHFNDMDTEKAEKKDVEESLFRDISLLGKPDNLVRNTKPNFIYQDGLNQKTSPEENHIGLILNGEGNGMEFCIPGSTNDRLLYLYIGSWASEATVTMTVNGEAVYEETYGKTETSEGGRYFENKIRYRTVSEQDEVKVRIETVNVYDNTWGNINIDALALSEIGTEMAVTAEISTLENEPEILMSQEGNVDWMYFNHTDLGSYEYKNQVKSYLTNVEAFGETGGITNNTFASFHYTDGAMNKNNDSSYTNEKKGIIFNHADNGMSFDVEGCTHERILRLYTGGYQATIGIEVFLNEDTKPIESVEYVLTDTVGKKTEIRFQTEKMSDVLHVQVKVKSVTDAAWGSVSVFAATLFDENPPAIEVPDDSDEMLGNEEGMVKVNHAGGKINSLQLKQKDGSWLEVPFKQAGTYAGPAWKIDGKAVSMKKSSEDPHTYAGIKDGVEYGIHYTVSDEGILTVTASMENQGAEAFVPDQASMVLGMDTYMKDTYESYKGLFFPTLLRCEKTHFWGYLESPEQKVISLAVDAPVSSYHMEYESGAHRIQTAILDLMQKDETLPERHPRNNNTLQPGEKRVWNLKLKLSDCVADVKEDIHNMMLAPTLDADKYTLAKGEKSNITVFSSSDLESIQVTAPDGSIQELPVKKTKEGIYSAVFSPSGDMGVYQLTVEAGGYRAEAMISLRQTWKWYMQRAKEAAISHPAKGADCAESWYNLYTAYLGEKYFPDEKQREIIDSKMDEIYYRVVKYSEEGIPTNNPNRIQNHSTTIGILTDKYCAEKNTQDLVRAAKIADYLISRQDARTGAYIGPTGDYTSVIYPAKSLMELMKQEKELIESGDTSYDWQNNYDKQYDSVKKAMDNLVALKGELHTEGQLTFEDGAFSCSATQLSEFALMHKEGSAERKKYMQSALEYLNKHQALEQEIIPDSRMNGGSLRFWEAQYDVLLYANPNNMMNSPHGWTAWNIYAIFNMYQLTGDEYYLQKGMNAMGSCAQLMSLDGNLNWAFIADPYIKGSLFVQKDNDTSEYGEGIRQDVILGESYVDMISDWWRTPPDTNVGGYYGQGGACDNDVHEIFKCMEETVLTRAYIVEQEDGSFHTYNCTAAEDENGVLQIKTMEDEITGEISLNLRTARDYQIEFSGIGKNVSGTAQKGLSAITDTEQIPEETERPMVKELLEIIYNAYKDMDVSGYTNTSVQALKDALAAAEHILGQEETDDAKIRSAAEAIMKAAAELVFDTSEIEAKANAAAKEAKEAREAAEKAALAAKEAYEKIREQENFVQTDLPVQAGQIYESGDYLYKVTSIGKRTAEVTGIKNSALTKINVCDRVTIAGQVYQVTSVADAAFKGNKKVTGAVVGKNVTRIGKNAFAGCTKLKKIVINGTGLKQIGSKAFYNCKKLNTITLKSRGLKKVGSNAFKGISKKAVFKVPASKRKAYMSLLVKKGQSSITVKKM